LRNKIAQPLAYFRLLVFGEAQEEKGLV